MTNQEEIYRGEAAKQLLANPLLKDAFRDVKDGIVSAMSTSAMGDEKTHNRLVIALQILHQIEKSIQSHVETGQMAAISIQEKSRLRNVIGL